MFKLSFYNFIINQKSDYEEKKISLKTISSAQTLSCLREQLCSLLFNSIMLKTIYLLNYGWSCTIGSVTREICCFSFFFKIAFLNNPEKSRIDAQKMKIILLVNY